MQRLLSVGLLILAGLLLSACGGEINGNTPRRRLRPAEAQTTGNLSTDPLPPPGLALVEER
jgi:hypothetical protein